MQNENFTLTTRAERARAMLDSGLEPELENESVFIVPSQSTEQAYNVIQNWDKWVCSCPDWKYCHGHIGDCKHIVYVKYWREMKDYLFKNNGFEPFEVMYNKPSCSVCGSFKVKGHGVRKNKGESKRRFKCQSCKHTFIQHSEFRGLKGQAKTVTACMDLYFTGCSLRKIQDHLKQFYEVEVHHETIRRWINKFMARIRQYTEQQHPAVSRTWHVDEMKYKNKQEWNWIWNMVDSDTRFLLANHVTDSRYTKDARAVFRKAKNVTPFQPEFITSDGLQSYKHAVEKEFRTLRNRNTQHIAGVGIRSRIHNNKVERLHGTLRERLKVQRGLQNHATTTRNMDNFRTYYNYLRPHQALDGKTPSQAAEIVVPIYGKNRWLSLIKKEKN